jgi:transposase
MAAAPWIVSDELWELVGPLLPVKARRFRYPGRKRPDRQALQGILFVLHTGIAWQHLPRELGFGSGVTCWRRLDEWQRVGVWQQLHALLLARLRAAGELEWSRRSPTPARCTRKRGLRDGPEPGRPRPTGLQTPPPRRRDRHPARLLCHGRQPQRRHPADPAHRRRPGRTWRTRSTTPPTRHADRRPRLRPRQVPAAALAARRQAGNRTPPDRPRLRARSLPLGRRAHLRLAA